MPQFSQSKFAAWFQNIVSRCRDESGLYSEITGYLPLEGAERVLNIGTGTVLQLRVIHHLQPSIGLFGIDLSAPAIDAAKKAIGILKPDLRVGSIEKTTYPDDLFDVVTCNSSMSYWDNPIICFNEIYRISKPGSVVKLFEPRQNIDLEGALDQIRKLMADKSLLRRWGAVQLNKFVLKRSSKVGLNLYTGDDLLELTRASNFGENSSVDHVLLLDIPIFVCIHLWKP